MLSGNLLPLLLVLTRLVGLDFLAFPSSCKRSLTWDAELLSLSAILCDFCEVTFFSFTGKVGFIRWFIELIAKVSVLLNEAKSDISRLLFLLLRFMSRKSCSKSLFDNFSLFFFSSLFLKRWTLVTLKGPFSCLEFGRFFLGLFAFDSFNRGATVTCSTLRCVAKLPNISSSLFVLTLRFLPLRWCVTRVVSFLPDTLLVFKLCLLSWLRDSTGTGRVEDGVIR